MASVVASHPRVLLVGAADLNPELRARFRRDHDVIVNDDAEALMRRSDIDAAYIATPHQFHREHVLLAARHGKHVVVEKPMALSLEDCDAMIEAAERSRVTLIVGHTHSYDPAIKAMRGIIAGETLGKLAMLAMWNYTDFLYRPRRPEELDTRKGGGILFNQIPHQIDVARLLAGSAVRSVRAMTGILDPKRPTEGCCMAFLDFADGVAATLVYSGYDRFDSDELHGWVAEGGGVKRASHGAAYRGLRSLGSPDDEARERWQRYGYGGQAKSAATEPGRQPHFGVLIASCERGDLRQSADGVLVYTDEGAREIPLPFGIGRPGWAAVMDELYEAVVVGKSPVHDGKFGKATVQSCLAILRSSRERREIVL